ncbi:MAG: helix-turn-helix transcriptional regulator [Clostridia bacterium]|nr:helix-turn-helix transcriptional regulator [Clostridia bacterium]
MDKSSISSDLIRGHIDTIILHSLKSGDKFAQQIGDVVKEKSDGEYAINQATLYSSLKRLEKLEYIKGYWHDTIGGRRRYFNLTEAGKNYVDDNLSNWAFSRAIIDKLMDYSAPSEIKTVYVSNKDVKTEQIPVINKIETDNTDDVIKEKTDKPIFDAVKDDKDVNYRAILSGLINYSNKTVEENQEILPINAIDSEKVVEIEPTVKNFNEEITSDFTAKKYENYSSIDYKDVIEIAKKDDFSIRVSSKKSIKTGQLSINKIRLFSGLSVFLLSILIMLTVITAYNGDFSVKSSLPIILSLIALAVIPTVSLVFYIKKPQKSVKSVNGDGILISAIVVFNLLLITFAINMLFNNDFYNAYNFIVSFIFPAIVYIEIFLFYTFIFAYSKLQRFKVNN